jgi:hypothetical protein
MDSQTNQKSQTIFLAKKTRREKDGGRDSNRVTKGRWTSTEHQRFIQACLKYGCEWKKVCLN